MKLSNQTRRRQSDFYYVQTKNIYDKNIARVILDYCKMHEIIIDCIPFSFKKKIKVLDLGVGTGANSYSILKKFINAEVTGIDLFEQMLAKAQNNLKTYKGRFEPIKGDITKIKFHPAKYDVIVSALTIHHLSPKDKKSLFKKIFNSLKKGGVFINGDLTSFRSRYLDRFAQNLSDQYMKKNVKNLAIRRGWYRHWHTKNILSTLESQVKWLEQCGFKNVTIPFRYYQTAVFCGQK